jgi:hypothetical protein
MAESIINQEHGENWTMYNGDCVDTVRNLPDNSIGCSIYSPPFVGLYIYSDNERDMGNCRTDEEFFAHYKFLVQELFRVTIPGRLTIVHCKDLPAYYHRDGYAGLKDFPGDIIRVHEACGWCYHSRVTIWKCPVVERERTNNNGLLHKTIMRDQSQVRQGMADYVLVFRRVPDATLMSDAPVGGHGLTEYTGLDECDPRRVGTFHPSPYSRKSVADNDSINIWRRYAEPVWWDINQQNVLNDKIARENADEKHICPLQLDVIRRALQLWSNPGDVVLSPFAGIGSEGHEAIKMARRFVGVELKEAYYRQAVRNCETAARSLVQKDMPLFAGQPTSAEAEPEARA